MLPLPSLLLLLETSCEDALEAQGSCALGDESSSNTLRQQMDALLLQMQPQQSRQKPQAVQSSRGDCSPTHVPDLNLPPCEAQAVTAVPAVGPAASPTRVYPLNIPVFHNAYINPLAAMSPSSPQQARAQPLWELPPRAPQPATDSMCLDAVPPAAHQSEASSSQHVAAPFLCPQQSAAPSAAQLSSDRAASCAGVQLEAGQSSHLPDKSPPAASTALLAAQAQAFLAGDYSLQQACQACQWEQVQLVSLQDGGNGLLRLTSNASQGGDAAAEELEMEFLNSSANGSAKVGFFTFGPGNCRVPKCLGLEG